MPLYYKLAKTLKVGTTYEAPKDIGYIVRRIGTDGSTDTKLVIDGKPTGPIIADIAPLHKTSSNLLGPLDLGEKYYVIPPERKFWVEGPSGAKMRIEGKIVKLMPGETFPADLLDRFSKQFKDYITYIKQSYSLGTNVTWSANQEIEIYTLTPRTIEEYLLDSYIGVKVENLSSALEEGQIALRFYYDGVPLDHLTSDPGHLGIDVKYIPYPPSDTEEEEIITLAEFPIKVLGDHTLKVTAINVSGGDLSPATDTSITVTFYALVKYLMKG